MIKLSDLLKEEYGAGPYNLPENHKAGMKVPKGGACCANCKWWVSGEKSHCSNKYYEEWAGTDQIPYSPDQYCTDWWEPIKIIS